MCVCLYTCVCVVVFTSLRVHMSYYLWLSRWCLYLCVRVCVCFARAYVYVCRKGIYTYMCSSSSIENGLDGLESEMDILYSYVQEIGYTLDTC